MCFSFFQLEGAVQRLAGEALDLLAAAEAGGVPDLDRGGRAPCKSSSNNSIVRYSIHVARMVASNNDALQRGIVSGE